MAGNSQGRAVDAGRSGGVIVGLPFGRSSERAEARAPLLPTELAFLAQQGVAPDILLSALSSGAQGLLPLEAILAAGVIDEERYYAALARRLGCSYYRGLPEFAPDFDPVRSLRYGVAPLEGGLTGPRAVIAPDGLSVARLIEATSAGRLSGRDFAIVAPRRLAALIRMRGGKAILADALGRLPDVLSARRGPTGRQIAAGGGVALLAALTGVANPQALTGALSLMLWAFFLATIALRSMAAVADNATPKPPPVSDDEAPVYTVVAAVYREADVIENLIRAFEAFDYPKAKLDIRIVVEERDAETLARLARLNLPSRYSIVVAPPGQPSTKPRALNIALAEARGELLVVYDAEDRPAPDQLRLAASRFAQEDSLECLQARLVVRNSSDSWLSRLFALEYAALFDLVNPGLCALDLPISLGGTSNHFRLASLVAAGGWDEWNVAEDADLGIRFARARRRIGGLDSETTEEAPHELGNWFRQRVRWQKGWMQTGIVHAREPRRFVREVGGRRALAAAALVLGSVAGALFWPLFAFDTIRRAIAAVASVPSGWREAVDLFTYSLALAGIWSIVVPAWVAGRQRRLGVDAKTLALLPVYYGLVSAAAWTAIFDLALRPHYWAKTAHGRTRAQTRARPRPPLSAKLHNRSG
jgi:glycosyltransferase XagB